MVSGNVQFQSTPSLRMVTRQAHAWSMGAGIFQSTPSLRMLTANLYNDTQYFLYRFGEIHNFVLYTSYLLRFTLPWCGFAGHFSVRSSRKFYDCLGFALHRQTQHLIHYTISVEGTGLEGRLRAQGHITRFVLKYKGPGHIIP